MFLMKNSRFLEDRPKILLEFCLGQLGLLEQTTVSGLLVASTADISFSQLWTWRSTIRVPAQAGSALQVAVSLPRPRGWTERHLVSPPLFIRPLFHSEVPALVS